MTAQDPFYPEIHTFYDAVLFNGFKGVARTGGLKAAPLSDYGANNQLISPNTDFDQSLHFIDCYRLVSEVRSEQPSFCHKRSSSLANCVLFSSEQWCLAKKT